MKLPIALPSRRRAAHAACSGLAGLCALLGSGTVHAEPATAATNALDAATLGELRTLAQTSVRTTAPGVTRVDIDVGALDARLRLAPCERAEPYLLNGTRLWGKTRIGLRCTRGATLWNVFLPLTVKVYGRALVAAAALPAGSVLGAADLAQAEVDLAEEASPVVLDGRAAAGRSLTQPLKAGQALRQAHLKARVWFAAGDTVQVLAAGPGFYIASEGQALSNGIEGQPARVRTERGKIVSGVPVGEHRLEMAL